MKQNNNKEWQWNYKITFIDYVFHMQFMVSERLLTLYGAEHNGNVTGAYLKAREV